MAAERGRGWTVAGVVRDRAAADPGAVLLRAGEAAWTAADLDARSSGVAQGLAAAGCGAGDRVAVVARNVPTFYEVLLGAAKLGAVTVGVNWRLGAEEVAYVVADAGAKALFVAHELAEHLPATTAGPAGPPLVVELGPAYEAWLDGHPSRDPGHEAEPGDVAVQIYTSGTTSASKGVLLTNEAIGFSVGLVDRFGVVEGATALVNLPQFHFGGSVYPLWAWSVGASCVLHEEFDARLVVEQARHTVNCLVTVPTMLRAMCDAADERPGPFPALRRIGYGSAPITEALLDRAIDTFDCDFVQTYGSTETCGVVTQLTPEDHARGASGHRRLRSAGRPVPGVEVLIGDARTGATPPVGEVGDIWVRSPMNMLGYWNKREASADVRTDDNWVRTGDLGYLDADGYLFLADRANEMIITGGENVYPAQVENVLASHPAVGEVAVVGVADERWGEAVTAVVVRRPGADTDAAELIHFVRERIAHYKAPRSVVFVDDELPKGATGKVLRREIRDALAAGRLASREERA